MLFAVIVTYSVLLFFRRYRRARYNEREYSIEVFGLISLQIVIITIMT